jgi:hypothetical protein
MNTIAPCFFLPVSLTDIFFTTSTVDRMKLQRDSGVPKTFENKHLAKPENDFRYYLSRFSNALFDTFVLEFLQ